MNRLTKRNATLKASCKENSTYDCLLEDDCITCDCNNKILEKLAHYEDLEEAGRLIELPCKVGDSLYKIVYPYRQPPKVTRYKVKNFRTIRKGQKLQIEVQADSSPVKSWMYFEDFYTTKAEAERKLAEMERANE